MSFASIKEFFSKLSLHDVPTGVAVLLGVLLLFLVFRTARFGLKLFFFLVAVGLIAGAYWWHTHK